jgi:hypothetical protein
LRSPRNSYPPWSSVPSASVFTLKTEFVVYHVPSTLDMDLMMYGLINVRVLVLAVATALDVHWDDREDRHREADCTGQADTVQFIGGYDFL